MVKKITIEGRDCYYCEECETVFEDKKLACECEDYCRKNKSCNLEVIKFSLNKQEVK